MNIFYIITFLFILSCVLYEAFPKLKNYFLSIFTGVIITLPYFVLGEVNILMVVSTITIFLISTKKENPNVLYSLYLNYILLNTTTSLEIILLLPMLKIVQSHNRLDVTTNLFSILFSLLVVFLKLISNKIGTDVFSLIFIIYLYIEMHFEDNNINNLAIDFVLKVTFPFWFLNVYMAEGNILNLTIVFSLLALIFIFELFKLLSLSARSFFVESILSFTILMSINTNLDNNALLCYFLVLTSLYVKKYILLDFKYLSKLLRKTSPLNPLFIITLYILQFESNSYESKSILLIFLIIPALFMYKNDEFIISKSDIHSSYYLNFISAFLTSLFILTAITVKILL